MTTNHSSTALDLSSCDREPIHILGNIQPFGALIAVTPDWLVTRASTNAASHWGANAEDMIGTPLSDHAQPSFIASASKRVRMLVDQDSIERIFGVQLTSGGPLYDVAIHASTGGFIIEVELHDIGHKSDFAGNIQSFIDRLQRADDLDAMTNMAARQMKALTGFDRVMVYRLSQEGEGAGEVVAEAREDAMEPFLGLRYPASDIPAQARKMYLRSLLRIISDVNAEPVQVIPELGPNLQPLDLSLSTLRAVSPIHLEYLRNMGVQASMSISIIRNGKLWGLFACHHNSARTLSYEVRSAAELFGQMFSFIQSDFEDSAIKAADAQFSELHHRLLSGLADGRTLTGEFDLISNAVQSVIDCDGVAICVDGQFRSSGFAPDEEAFGKLARFFNTAAASQVYSTDNLASVLPDGRTAYPDIAGLLAIPVSREPRDYIACFRKEVAKSVTWAGNPDKTAEVDPDGTRLRPRKSFAAWVQEVRDQSEPWSKQELLVAERLRVSLLEVVLKMAGNAAKDAARVAERQELLIAELNHRVRNILNLIRGLISQSVVDGEDVTSFSEKIGGRVHSLARAHDQITKQQWGPASLHELVRAEMEAYINVDSNRLRFAGPDVLLAPNAFTAIALVMHELMTNSAKYGALTDHRGHVDFVTELSREGDLNIKWQDCGGPAVQAPTRRGFGTTIIERSIPFELNGEAEIKYDVSGVRARFRIPAEHIADKGNVVAESKQEASNAGVARLSGHVLLVEDNMIIAMDSEEMLLKLGAEKVHLASNVATALNIVEAKPISFALLDVNLGDETSLPVAQALQDKNCPFVFATGYGESSRIADPYPGALIVQKPIDSAILNDAVTKVLSSRD